YPRWGEKRSGSFLFLVLCRCMYKSLCVRGHARAYAGVDLKQAKEERVASERDGWCKTLTYTAAEVAALSYAGCDADTPSHMHAVWLLFARECCELEVAFEPGWVVVFLGVLGKQDRETFSC